MNNIIMELCKVNEENFAFALNLITKDNLQKKPQQILTDIKSFNNIQKYGNCSAASIPICLAECVDQGKIKRGDLVAMTGFGSGFTWGTALVRF